MRETNHCPRCGKALREGVRFCTACGLSAERAAAWTDEDVARATAEDEARRTAGPLVGRVLDSKYELVALLGEGGMGAVYRARRLHIGDEVAVKVLHQRAAPDPGAAERFRREARSAAMISHPNIVTIHDFCEERGWGAPAYIVMELVRGESLRGLLAREGRLAPGRAAALMRDVCAGVGAAHRQGLVHRDLKPDNVIVVPPAGEGEREVAKVVDFGIAKLRGSTAQLTLTQAGAMVGTPFYMSPEQCRGEHLDSRADVYSLGAMLYEMLSGAPPFRANNLPELIAKQLTGEPQGFPSHLGLSPALERVCLRALSKDPGGRQADAIAFSREIQEASEAQAAEDPRPRHAVAPPAVQARTDTKATARAGTLKRPLAWAAAGLLVMLFGAAALAALVWYQWGPVRDDRAGTSVTANAGARQEAGLTAGGATPQEAGAGNLAGGSSASGAEDAAAREAPEAARDLKGRWVGSLGPLGLPTTLDINESKSGKFGGVLEQGGIRVAFTGEVDFSTRQVKFKETRVLSGSGWNLGENSGTISPDWQDMSGTGVDPMAAQLGITYPWSFSRRGRKL